MAIELHNADCFDFLKTMPDKCVDLVVTDPPYDIDTVGSGIMKKEHYQKELTDISNGFNFEILHELVRVMKKINIYIFCSNKQIYPLLNYFIKKLGGGITFTMLSWHKTNPIPTCGNKYLSDTEYCLYFRQAGVHVGGTAITKKTYYLTPSNTFDKKQFKHPTVKPLHIIKNFIINSSSKDDVVIDPFMGSGTTGVACVELKRNFVGIEINQKYFEIAKQRITNTQRQNVLFRCY